MYINKERSFEIVIRYLDLLDVSTIFSENNTRPLCKGIPLFKGIARVLLSLINSLRT